jgi:class 3 adenylate cyclase
VDGERLGWLTIYGPGARAAIAALVIRGDQEMFARMAELVEPARRPTAVLFADIQASSRLARHISTAGYFELIRGFTTAVDETVIRHEGIVGRHAGDGVTAFFLADQIGSTAAPAPPPCARAARSSPGGPRTAARLRRVRGQRRRSLGRGALPRQIVTGGRLEITALGDEVNECARIQQTARNGSLLASKPLIERLDREDADALGLDPLTLSYRTVGELPGVTHKSVRDAGGVPVVHVPWAG